MVPTNIWCIRHYPSYLQQTYTKFSFSRTDIRMYISRAPLSIILTSHIYLLKLNDISFVTHILVIKSRTPTPSQYLSTQVLCHTCKITCWRCTPMATGKISDCPNYRGGLYSYSLTTATNTIF